MKLGNKVALITGGNSGIGLATAKLFCAEGASVVIVGRNADTLLDAVSHLGRKALTLQEDLTDPAAIDRVVRAAAKRFGKLDVIFANAGRGPLTPIGSTSVAEFEHVMRLNVTSPFLLVQAALPYLSNGSSIIFNGSVSGLVGRPATSAYAASKGALRAMARVMAAELSPSGIRVNVLSPGSIQTPIWSTVTPPGPRRDALFRQIKKSVPMGRMGKPMEVARAALFLASSDSSFIQAAEIIVDGGISGAPMGAPVYRDLRSGPELETSQFPLAHETSPNTL